MSDSTPKPNPASFFSPFYHEQSGQWLDSIFSDEYDGVFRILYPKVCNCGKVFYVPQHRYHDRRSCSKQCDSKARQRQIDFVCAECGKTFTRMQSKVKRSKHGVFFCCRDCKDKFQANDSLKIIQPAHYGSGEKNYRVRAFKRLGKRCCQCGYDEHEQMLDVDHIDSDRTNNKLENLQVLCLWCHGLKTRRMPFHEWKPKDFLNGYDSDFDIPNARVTSDLSANKETYFNTGTNASSSIKLPSDKDIEEGFLHFSHYIVSAQFDGCNRKLYPKACRCGAIFWLPRHKYKKLHYCSTKCAALASRNRETFICAHCQNPFERRVSSKAHSKTGYRFCCRACKDAAQGIDGTVKAIRPKKYKEGHGSYRARAIRHYGGRCAQCGYDQHEQMLDADHIDSDRANNNIENIQVLCFWCHGLKTRGVPYHAWQPKQHSEHD